MQKSNTRYLTVSFPKGWGGGEGSKIVSALQIPNFSLKSKNPLLPPPSQSKKACIFLSPKFVDIALLELAKKRTDIQINYHYLCLELSCYRRCCPFFLQTRIKKWWQFFSWGMDMFTPGSLIKGERILTFITYHIFKVRFSFLLFSQLPFQVKQFYVSCLHNTKGYPKCKYKKGGLKTCVFL